MAFVTTFSKTVRFFLEGVPLRDGTKYILTREDRILFGSWERSDVPLLKSLQIILQKLMTRYNDAPVQANLKKKTLRVVKVVFEENLYDMQ